MSLWRRVVAIFNGGRVYQGKDQFGNLYYEKAATPGIYSNLPRRTVKMQGDVYDQTRIPVAWRGWMAHRRPDPPTMEELLKEDQRRMAIQQRAKLLDDAWAERKKMLALASPTSPDLSDCSNDGPKDVSQHEDARLQQGSIARPKRPPHFDPRKDQYQPESWTPTSTPKR